MNGVFEIEGTVFLRGNPFKPSWEKNGKIETMNTFKRAIIIEYQMEYNGKSYVKHIPIIAWANNTRLIDNIREGNTCRFTVELHGKLWGESTESRDLKMRGCSLELRLRDVDILDDYNNEGLVSDVDTELNDIMTEIYNPDEVDDLPF